MTQPEQSGPFERLIQDFTPEDRAGRRHIIGRMAAVRAGVAAVQGLVETQGDPQNRDPQVTAAAIQAIGSMVGSYVEALGERLLSGGLDSRLREDLSVTGGIRVDARLRFPEPPPPEPPHEPPEPALVPR